MRRGLALLLLLVIASFLAAEGSDHCEEGLHGHGHHIQHILCPDDCAPALIPAPPAPPPPDPLPRPAYAETVILPLLSIDLEPEKAPPRA